jgi:hypothetical protein
MSGIVIDQIPQTLNIICKLRRLIKVVLTTKKTSQTYPVKRHLSNTCPVCINKGIQCLIISLTHSAHLVRKFGSCSWEKKEERGALPSLGYSLVFWFIVLALYWISILRKFLLGFLPHEGFPG